MRLAVHQPNYIPWCGYFAKMSSCDVFIFLDDAEISPGQSFVYRSLINSKQGPFWLSVPTHRGLKELINTVRFAGLKWSRKHLNSLRTNYGKSLFFDEVYSLIEPFYLEPGGTLALFNIKVIKAIADYLSISCRFELSSKYNLDNSSDDRLISLAQLVNADVYVSGKGGQNYQNPSKFTDAKICLATHEYIPITYTQLHGDFIPGLSILDALFNLGRECSNFLKYQRIK